MRNTPIALVTAGAFLIAACLAQTSPEQSRSQAQKGKKTMQFMLMMNMKTDPESMSKGLMTWSKEDIQAHTQFMHGLNKQLKQSGELVSCEGLAWPDQAKLVRAGQNGDPVTDGVFPESKEFLIGYWIIDVDSPDRAYRIASQASAAPGRGGVPLNMAIEVRQINAAPPE